MKHIYSYCIDRELTTKRFFDLCQFYGIRNKDLAKLFDVSDTTISYWRNGTRFPEYNKIMLFAYTVGLPLELVIIRKKEIENPHIKKILDRIYELKERKYKEKLQELLDRGFFDHPPQIQEDILCPLVDEAVFLDTASPQYVKLILDVSYYGLKKRE